MEINGSNCSNVSGLPNRVGIRGMELYIPKLYVEQEKLEKYDNVSDGKYTRGLGQHQMGFCADHEDITSICCTVVSKLLYNYKLSAKDVGFLAVGTETLTDKSKSVKTSLMRLFEDNCDIEGVDVKNACFGGTQALFHAVDWIYANWDVEHRYAIAVMADIAVYDDGPARCTGGAGAFAALIGPNALICFDRGLRATHIVDVWDFYKPNQPIATEYPVVNGPISLQSYFACVEKTYELYCKKAQKLKYGEIDLSKFYAIFFHCPFTRLVQKAFGLLAYLDYKHGFIEHLDRFDAVQADSFLLQPCEQLCSDRNFVQLTATMSDRLWKVKTEPFLLFNRRVGNMYTASLYSQLVAFCYNLSIKSANDFPNGQRLLFFSYGSGAAAAMFSAHMLLMEADDLLQFNQIKRSCQQAAQLLDERLCISPERYNEILELRRKLITSSAPYEPEAVRNGLKDEFSLLPGTFYLKNIDIKYRRHYAQK